MAKLPIEPFIRRDSLDAYIENASSIDRPASPAVAAQWIDKHWGKPHDYQALRPYRAIVAWRITRLIARAKGSIGPTNLLADAPPSSWQTGTSDQARPSPLGTDIYVRGLQEIGRASCRERVSECV